MSNVFYVGMDVHKESVRVAVLKGSDKETVYEGTHKSDITKIVKLVKAYTAKGSVVAGYEAGCMGYTLQRALAAESVECRVIPPNHVPRVGSQRIKTDSRDAVLIARMLKNNEGGGINIPTAEDEATRDLLRCRDDIKLDLNRCKQRLSKFLLRLGYRYEKEATWTKAHRDWMKALVFINELHRETFEQYYSHFEGLEERLDRLDERIKTIATSPVYQEAVARLRCFKGIDHLTALALVCEVSDFARFPNAQSFMAYVGLVPSEYSSGGKRKQGGITKTGNTHLRNLLIESSWHYRYYSSPSVALKKRRQGNSELVIGYADKAFRRLQGKHIRLVHRGKNSKTATTAIARELAGFVWGMMTENYA
jgi:transposase